MNPKTLNNQESLSYQIDAILHENRGNTVKRNMLVELISQARQEAEQAAFKRGQRVGQYQAAEKLYGDATTIWLFKDGKYPDQLKMNLERTDDMLKDCEKYMNHNAKVYREYVKSLSTY